jgi:hypothetical protein
MLNPYDGLPPRAFWRSAVTEGDPATPQGLWQPRFALLPGTRIATAGSCFAQNLRAPLSAAGLTVVDTEPPLPGLTAEDARRHGYGLFSARYGNIYTARHLCQLVRDITERRADAADVWFRDGRAFDALRPGVEPGGLADADEVIAHRLHHLDRAGEALAGAEVLVFTLGLTETWMDAATGRVYPTAPGVLADPPRGRDIRFHNHSFAEVLADLRAALDMLRGFNHGLRLLLTVSPVPLTATAAGGHVLAATTYSKAVLRAVAGEMAGQDGVDYFPSYEIITNPAARGRFHAPNLRSMTAEGVAAVMAAFLAAQGLVAAAPAAAPAPTPVADEDAADDAVICEDALLEAFRPA